MIVVDSREQSAELKAAADEVRLLRYDGPNGEVWSYDIEVTTAAGQVLRGERKLGLDAVGSFEKLERQVAPCDFLVLENWNEKAWLLSERAEDPKFRHLLESVKKRIWRLSFSRAILYSKDVHETIVLLRYLKGKTEAIHVR